MPLPRRSTALAIVVCVAFLLLPEVAWAANKAPRIARGRMRDADGDRRADRLVLTYNERIKHKADRDGKYPFAVQGYKIASVKKARRIKKLVIKLKERDDAPAEPNVTYRRSRKQPVKDLKGKQARRQTFVDVLGLDLAGPGPGPGEDALTVVTDGPGRVVSVPPGTIDCPETCSANLEEGTSVQLTALPDPGATFVAWGGACSGPVPLCTVTMEGDQSVEATFEAAAAGGDESFTLTVEVVGTGTVTSIPEGVSCPGTCEADFPEGSGVTLSGVPAGLVLFLGWSGDCAALSDVPVCPLKMDGDKTAGATFGLPEIAPR